MKFTFKKIASVLASAVMLSSTVALAAAANYPAPFVSSGAANVAVVWGGADTAAQTDLVAAQNIASSLQAKVSGAAAPSAVSGGDSVKLERATDKFNLGDEMDDFYSSLDEEELSHILASGIYTNDDNDEFDFEQSITLAPGLKLEHFVDSELDDNEVPVIGFNLNSGDSILNYTLEFTDPVDVGAWVSGNALETTEITMLGRNYYVVSARNTTQRTITLLDTANSATVSEGGSTTINVGGTSYSISLEWVSENKAILKVDGVETNKLGEGDVYKVGENLYLGVKDILYSSKESGVSKVSISLGSGKIALIDNDEVQINNEDISKNTDSVLNAYIDVDGDDLESITLEWILDDDAWIVPERELVLPGFETIKLSMGGFIVDKKEMTKLTPDGDDSIKLDAEIKDGSVSLNLFYLNSSNTGIAGLGEKDSHKLVTSSGSSVTLNESEKSYFVATWISGDDAESYAFEIRSIDDESGKNKTTLKNLASGSELVFSEVGKTKDVGSLQLTLSAANDANKVATISASASSGNVYLDRLVTKEGLMMKLPVLKAAANYTATPLADGEFASNASAPGYTNTAWGMNFTEELKAGDIQKGASVKVTIAVDGDDGLETTSAITGVNMIEDGDDTDNYVGYVESDLATRFWQSRPSTGLNKLEVEYHGTEAYADVYVSEAAAVISGGGAVSIVPITDSEAASVATNMIVVGGSCVNTIAAELLGSASPLCGPDFTARTGVGAGEFLIQTFERAGGKVATLVAGYNADDTTNAATYLRTQAVDTTAGKKYKGTSATSATLVTV